jgi:hypothetical protein
LSTPFNFKRVSERAFEFTTENAVKYRASFSDGASYFSNYPEFRNKVRTFQFLVLENPHSKVPVDARVGVTISYIVTQFFEQNPDEVLFFIHDASDGKGNGRLRKFNDWFRRVGVTNLLKKDDEIIVGRFTVLVSIVLRKNHPHSLQITEAFDQLIVDASEKPED